MYLTFAYISWLIMFVFGLTFRICKLFLDILLYLKKTTEFVSFKTENERI